MSRNVVGDRVKLNALKTPSVPSEPTSGFGERASLITKHKNHNPFAAIDSDYPLLLNVPTPKKIFSATEN